MWIRIHKANRIQQWRNEVTVVCLCCFRSYFAHFNYSLARCCFYAAVIAVDVFLKSFTIVSTHRRRHVASKTGFKPESPNPNLDSDSLTECTFLLNKKHLKNVGPIRHCEPPHAALPFTRCRYCRTPPLSHAACASMSTTTTTTRDRGDRYGLIEWAQLASSMGRTDGRTRRTNSNIA